MLDVSIVLPTRNNEHHIGRLLDSIFSQDFCNRIEVVMLDSSNDHTPQIASRLCGGHDLQLIRIEPDDYNYGATRNLGASKASNGILVMISTDVDIRSRSWLRTLLGSLADPLVAGVYGRQVPKEDASPMERFFIEHTYPLERKVQHLKPGERIKDFFFSTTNSAIRRDVWRKIPLPEMLISEDQEWAKRALLAGYKIVYDPEAVVYHSHNYTLKQAFKRYFDSGATLPYVYADSRIAMENFLVRGMRFERDEVEYFSVNGYLKSLPYAAVYEAMKFLGYTLGTTCMSMPIWMRKLLSMKSNHWDKYNSIISEGSTRGEERGRDFS